MRRKIKLSKKKLYKLYHIRKLSPVKIAEIYKCSFATVSNRIKEYGIPLKTKSQAQMIYQKEDFNGNTEEKSYMVGFRLGDLNVYKTNTRAETIVVRCNTSSHEQIKLINDLFNKYGHVTVCNSKNNKRNVNCYLNRSFNFLMVKNDKVESWIYKNRKAFIAFMAGYIDAEGTFMIDQSRGRFKIDSYDKNILMSMSKWLKNHNLNARLLRIGLKDEKRTDGTKFNSDLWRVNVNEAASLYEFIKIIRPYLRHGKRIIDLKKVEGNLIKRFKKGTVKND